MDRIWTGMRASLGVAAALTLAACGAGGDEAASGAADTAAAGPGLVSVPEGEATRYIVLTGGTEIGATQLSWGEAKGALSIFHEFRNNGRGPTYNEEITLDAYGYPVSWTIEGATTFGNAVDERFSIEDGMARWRDSTGEGEAVLDGPALYLPQNASPYQLAIAARVLMADEDGVVDALPGGQLRLTRIEEFGVAVDGEPVQLTSWAVSGATQNPTYILTDGEVFMGTMSPRFTVLAEGLESQDAELRALAAEYGARRYEEIQERTAHRYDGPVRVANVRLFDPQTEALTDPVSVVFEGERIIALEAADATGEGETRIDGAGGVLVPGLFEMHAHLGESSAALNIAAGVTSVRDTGNNNEVLDALIDNIQSGRVAGPRVFRSGFIEGRSPYNSNSGILVGDEEEALEAVRFYAESGDFHQIKIYNSTRPEWAPALIEEAHRLGMRVSGHIPAFTDADAMIEAGYDELTHINQLMLGWVLDEGEDTRTLLRLTALKRLPDLDLESEQVQSTIDAMVERGVAIDPTFAIHEALLLSRNGQVSPGTVDYVDHLPVSSQRSARSAWAAIETPEDDAAYRGAFEQITAALTLLRERGIFMVPGTDLGGSFAYHRELELYQTIGMTAPEILAWASQGMADYLGAGDELGSIDPGKYADFFLIAEDPTADLKAIKAISMVVADGVVYFPEDIHPEFGIRPFAEAPDVLSEG